MKTIYLHDTYIYTKLKTTKKQTVVLQSHKLLSDIQNYIL